MYSDFAKVDILLSFDSEILTEIIEDRAVKNNEVGCYFNAFCDICYSRDYFGGKDANIFEFLNMEFKNYNKLFLLHPEAKCHPKDIKQMVNKIAEIYEYTQGISIATHSGILLRELNNVIKSGGIKVCDVEATIYEKKGYKKVKVDNNGIDVSFLEA